MHGSLARSSLVQVIVNPVSGRSADRGVLATLCRRIHSAGHRVRVEETRGPGDARRLAAAACHAGAMLLIVSPRSGTPCSAGRDCGTADSALSRGASAA
ncbi:MAG: diacylglycerol kinase family protein, partial [Phycisphaerae bacterium]